MSSEDIYTSATELVPLFRRPTPPLHPVGPDATRSIRRKPLPVLPISSLLSREPPRPYVRLAPNDDEYSPLPDELKAPETSVHTHSTTADHRTHAVTTTPRPPWVPRALQVPFLMMLLVLNLALLVTVSVLHAKSAASLGLGPDDGSQLVFFLWRFVPTMIGVIYVFCWMVLTDSINRTEPFARLSKYRDSSGRATVLRVPGPWWSTLADCFPQRKNDRRSDVVLSATIVAYILGFLLLSPFSAALLVSKDISLSLPTQFHQFQVSPESALQPTLDSTTFFRTIGHIVQNVTTSAWITDKYSVVPFWPSGTNQRLGVQLSTTPQTWRTMGLVLQTELECESLTRIRGPTPVNFLWNSTSRWHPEQGQYASNDTVKTLVFSSGSGCEYGFAVMDRPYFGTQDGVPLAWSHWSGSLATNQPQLEGSNSILRMLADLAEGSTITRISDPNLLMNFTQACGNGYVIVSFIENQDEDEAFESSGRLCMPKFYAANVTIEARTAWDNVSTMHFDETEFLSNRQLVADSMVNVTGFQSSFLQADWNSHLRHGNPMSGNPLIGGAAAMLAALYDFKVIDMMHDAALVTKASEIQQRAFGETVQASLQNLTTLNMVSGQVITVERRICVVRAVAITLEVVLILHLICVTLILFKGRQSSRPLGLANDSAITNVVTALVASENDTRMLFKEITSAASTDSSIDITSARFTLGEGTSQVSRILKTSASPQRHPTESEKRHEPTSTVPAVFSTWLVSLLCCLIAMVLTAIMVLYWYSLSHGLYQKIFVYRTVVRIADTDLGTLAPYTIIPTLIAVGLGLWWGAIESFFKAAQPYITMAKGPTAARQGVNVSYQSSYMFWAAYVAMSRKHWLLALICLGVSSTPILTISMSALWQRQPSSLTLWAQAGQPLELREMPFLTPNVSTYKGLFRNDILSNLYNDFQTTWMYSATLQLVLNSSEPAWSQDGWSFVPLDLSNIRVADLPGSATEPDGGGSRPNVNVTVRTRAIRARIECDEGTFVDDCWLPGTDDISNSTRWQEATDPSLFSSGYLLSSRLTFSSEPSASRRDCKALAKYNDTTILPQGGQPLCCTQGTKSDPGTLTIARWSPFGDNGNQLKIVWLHGLAQSFQSNLYDDVPQIYWLEMPKLSATTCTAVTEKANASAVVDMATGKISKYEILDDPVLDTNGWAETFTQRQVYNGNPTSGDWNRNITTSYGVSFLQALLNTQLALSTEPCSSSCFLYEENDNTFNYRRPGLNLDFMSYAMLELANNNRTALLDPQVLIPLAQQTLTTFFQHFASRGVSVDGDGGWAYQRVNASLPADLRPPQNTSIIAGPLKSTGLTPSFVTVEVVRPVEMLQMSPVAVYLSVCILGWLLVTAVLLMVVKKRYFSPLLQGVESFADIAVLVAGSERYLALVQEQRLAERPDKNDYSTRLGWFRTSSGEPRWGIELVDDSVHWLSAKEVAALNQKPERRSR